MNRLLPFAVLSTSLAIAAQTDQRTWKWQQEIPIVTPGLIRLEVPPQTQNVCQPTLADLRVISPDGTEIPYLIDSPMRAAQSSCVAADFKADLAGGKTVLEARNPTQEAVTAVTLTTPGRNFLKSLQVEAAGADGVWQIVNPSDVVFHDPSDVARLTIPIPAKPWARIRVSLDDQRTLPVPFTGMKLTLAIQEPPTVSQPVSISQPLEKGAETTLEIDLGAANLMLAELRLQIADAVFMRHCTLA
ncbi:MAG TPA: hypothetical protein VFY13_09510, partial [Luteolibacter sp.]|nr:hypothetical protein [Luteolibacter sp.]